MKGTSVPLQ